ncbi:unnamed protein product [Vitrella brassicaformis CCMP3155]|uniref:C3H1-type domain-containing protein n=2 Tax=Vitrella brassicaformis TaxID=1169539 RepID=A0A0G4F8K4_VITBC|nr:unnamed protein product [Vitrella brassicaformis CCMP3155]|eukprot:CEM08475.1 unnamed protein product [Vitrella brassicaformis CCMP3155]
MSTSLSPPPAALSWTPRIVNTFLSFAPPDCTNTNAEHLRTARSCELLDSTTDPLTRSLLAALYRPTPVARVTLHTPLHHLTLCAPQPSLALQEDDGIDIQPDVPPPSPSSAALTVALRNRAKRLKIDLPASVLFFEDSRVKYRLVGSMSEVDVAGQSSPQMISEGLSSPERHTPLNTSPLTTPSPSPPHPTHPSPITSPEGATSERLASPYRSGPGRGAFQHHHGPWFRGERGRGGMSPRLPDVSCMTRQELLQLVPRDPTTGKLLSVGSIGHHQGACKPCVFVNNIGKGGCANGISCQFCHFNHTPRKKPPRPSKKQRQFLKALRQAQNQSDDMSPSSAAAPFTPARPHPLHHTPVSSHPISRTTTTTETPSEMGEEPIRGSSSSSLIHHHPFHQQLPAPPSIPPPPPPPPLLPGRTIAIVPPPHSHFYTPPHPPHHAPTSHGWSSPRVARR